MVRDQALALSGLLSRKVGGPSVFPPQPGGLWQAAFNGERTWSTSQGEDRYRRGLYTFWRRTVPYPSMATFDAPSREICAIKRRPDQYAAPVVRDLERPGLRRGRPGPGAADRARGGRERRKPAPATACSSACAGPRGPSRSSRSSRSTPPNTSDTARTKPAAVALATEPLGPLPPGMEPAELAAWTTVANVLLNLDGVLTKG